MIGLTKEGLRAKIKNNVLTLKEDEAVDLFFLYPGLVELKRENGDVINAFINGLNLDFVVGD